MKTHSFGKSRRNNSQKRRRGRPMNTKKAMMATFASLLALDGPMAFAAADTDSPPPTLPSPGRRAAPRALRWCLFKAVIVDLLRPGTMCALEQDIADSVVRTSTRIHRPRWGRRLLRWRWPPIANLELRVEPDANLSMRCSSASRRTPSVKAEAVNGALVLSGSRKPARTPRPHRSTTTNFGSASSVSRNWST